MNLSNEAKMQKQDISQKKRIKQRSKQDIFQHLLQLYQPNQNKIKPNEVFHQIQDIYELVSVPPKQRTSKTLKKLKSQLSELKCFKSPPYNEQNPEFMQIFRRDNINIINLISPFVQLTKYKKGKVIECTGIKRKSIKILLNGEIHNFQPANHKAFKNCLEKIKNNQIQFQVLLNSDCMLEEILLGSKSNNKNEVEDIYGRQQVQKIVQEQVQDTKRTNVTEQNNPECTYEAGEATVGDVLTKAQCRDILIQSNIISPLSPHKQARKLNIADFVVDRDQPMFVDQKGQYYCCAVCSTDSIFIEISYQVAKQVIQLIHNDRDRPFIQSLLFKFPILKYLQAKQYVTQDFMITYQGQQQGQQTLPKRKLIKKAIPLIKQLKIINSLNFELKYTGEIFLIISGNVTLVIDQIYEKKCSTLQEYIVSEKNVSNKDILHLYKNDVFGFEELGKIQEANLRYLVSMGSKLLKINPSVFRHHMQNLAGFKDEVNHMMDVRNQIIAELLQNMSRNLQFQQINRHSSISNPSPKLHLSQSQPHIKKTSLAQNLSKQLTNIKYLGHKKYSEVSTKIKQYLSPLRQDKPKQKLSPYIIQQNGLGIQFSKNLLQHQNQSIQISDGWIQTRNRQGKLLRKKKIVGNQGNQGKGDALLRKLGILNCEEIAEHNFEMVTKRPSKYEFDDLYKQAKEFKAIREKSQSLPKLKKFYAKKEDRLFTILYKRTHL